MAQESLTGIYCPPKNICQNNSSVLPNTLCGNSAMPMGHLCILQGCFSLWKPPQETPRWPSGLIQTCASKMTTWTQEGETGPGKGIWPSVAQPEAGRRIQSCSGVLHQSHATQAQSSLTQFHSLTTLSPKSTYHCCCWSTSWHLPQY